MELLGVSNPYIILSVFMSVMLTLCLIVLFFMRDPYSLPAHQVSRMVWCTGHESSARVDFVERVDTGMLRRSVLRCSLRGVHDRCNEACSRQPA